MLIFFIVLFLYRALDLATKHNTDIDIVLTARRQYLQQFGWSETIPRFIESVRKVWQLIWNNPSKHHFKDIPKQVSHVSTEKKNVFKKEREDYELWISIQWTVALME